VNAASIAAVNLILFIGESPYAFFIEDIISIIRIITGGEGRLRKRPTVPEIESVYVRKAL
jgi:hypothetical protein